MHLLAAIPSPGSNSIHLGPLQLRAYGLMIALGVLAAVWLAGKRFEAMKIGTRDDVSAIAMWGVPAGVIGARLYHVATDWELFRDDPVDIVKIWKGGLGIWGGIAAGVVFGLWQAKRRTGTVGLALTAVTPALPLAQAIGRLGNWWNQELFGRPLDKPWALEIDPEHRPDRFIDVETFHPTFLYESLWNLALCGFLIWVGARWTRLRPGRLFLVYVAGYTVARFFIERIRIDPANEIAGLRVNEWTSLVLFTGAVLWLAYEAARPGPLPTAAALGEHTATADVDAIGPDDDPSNGSPDATAVVWADEQTVGDPDVGTDPDPTPEADEPADGQDASPGG